MAPITLPPLVDAAETEPQPFVTSYNLNGREVALAIRPNIVTADFLEGLDARTQEERRQRLAAAARAALLTAPRATRRAVGSKRGQRKAKAVTDDPEATAAIIAAAGAENEEGETSLAVRARMMRFMADTCSRVVADWNLADRAEPGGPLVKIEPTAAYFAGWHFEQLQPFFEFVCFEAAAPGKKPSETSAGS